MFEERKIKLLEKHNKELRERNSQLEAQIEELQTQIVSMEAIVEAANNYTDEHRKALAMAETAKERYLESERQMRMLMKEYEQRQKELMKAFK